MKLTSRTFIQQNEPFWLPLTSLFADCSKFDNLNLPFAIAVMDVTAVRPKKGFSFKAQFVAVIVKSFTFQVIHLSYQNFNFPKVPEES